MENMFLSVSIKFLSVSIENIRPVLATMASFLHATPFSRGVLFLGSDGYRHFSDPPSYSEAS